MLLLLGQHHTRFRRCESSASLRVKARRLLWGLGVRVRQRTRLLRRNTLDSGGCALLPTATATVTVLTG